MRKRPITEKLLKQGYRYNKLLQRSQNLLQILFDKIFLSLDNSVIIRFEMIKSYFNTFCCGRISEMQCKVNARKVTVFALDSIF